MDLKSTLPVHVLEFNYNDPESNPAEKSKYLLNCCSRKIIRNDEVFRARKDLMAIMSDWLIDAAVGTMHIIKGNLIGGILTFFIVFQAGVVITFTNFNPREGSKDEISLIRSEIKKCSKFYGTLMYIPSFFPICSAKLRLEYAKKLKECTNYIERNELQNKMQIFKEKALWDSCCETFFEDFPQAVLQIVLLFLPQMTYNSFTDYLPIGSIFLALYGITDSPKRVMELRDKDQSMGHLETLTAYASNSFRVFSCALFILAILSFARGSSVFAHIGWIALSGLIFFCLLGGSFIVKYEIDKAFPLWRKRTMQVITGLSFMICLSGFYFWVISEVLPFNGWLHLKVLIVVGCYSILVFLACCGMLFYREKLELYQSTAADVLIQAYLGLKTFWGCGECIPVKYDDNYNELEGNNCTD